MAKNILSQDSRGNYKRDLGRTEDGKQPGVLPAHGQLVNNIAGWADVEVWDGEDGQLLATMKAPLDHLGKRDRTVKA